MGNSHPQVAAGQLPRWRRVVVVAAILALSGSSTAEAAGQPRQQARPGSVFDTERDLAIEAARERLGLFVSDNPVPTVGTEAPAPTAACPVALPDTLTSAAAALSTERTVALQLQTDPWLGSTSSDPELRPSSAAPGSVEGVPIVRCVTSRRADDQVTRAEVFAIALVDGVSFGDVARRHRLDPILRVRPAGIAGEMVGSCLDTADTSVCVVLWQSRSLVLGMTLEGPPTAVNTSTAGALLTTLVPDMVDTLAVVLRPPLACTVESIRADTTLTLLEEPTCHDGWAVGTTVACPADEVCPARDVFHVESSGWVHNGSIDVSCAETLARLGMTTVTAQKFAPICDTDDPSLNGGTIRPDTEGLRVTALQVALINLGYDMPIDGRYGPITEAAVVDFQTANGLTIDGLTGPQTQMALGI